MFRVSNNLLLTNYLSDLNQVQLQLAKLVSQTSTGKAFERPSDDPAATAVSLDLHSSLKYLYQYNRNIDDGISRLEYNETAVYEVDTQLQRVRELTVQASNSYLTRSDREAIAEELNQLLEHVVTIANSNYRGRYIFSGFESLTESFSINSNTADGMLNSVTYQGDYGDIERNIGNSRDLDVNLNGREVFIEQTYTLTGKQMSGEELGFTGAFEVNDELFIVTPEMTLGDIRDMLNQDEDIEVYASVTDDFKLQLESMNSTQAIEVRDISGTILEDTGLLPMGAYNLAQTAPTLPLTDSRGARDMATIAFAPLTLSTGTQDMVLTLSGEANDGYTQTEVLTLDAITYNTVDELAAEIQRKADEAFGEDKLIVTTQEIPALSGNWFIEIETFVQSSGVLASDLQIGGTASDGTVDTFSDILGFTAAPGAQEIADNAGTDGNDRFTIDLGLSAYRTTGDEEAIDLPPIEINIDATAVTDVNTLAADINKQILRNTYLSGLVEAKNVGGRLQLVTTKQGAGIRAEDMVIANAVPGAVADPPFPADTWDTLRALGFYRDAATGISEPPVPAAVYGTIDHSGGFVVAAGLNSFSIDLGPASSIDGTNPDPVTLTVTPGAYATATDLATEINTQINNSGVLKNAVYAVVRTVGPAEYVDIVTTNAGSAVQANDLQLVDDPLTPGTLAAFGLAAATTPGGGTAASQGMIDEARNMINTMIQIRDELYGYAAGSSRLTDLLDEDDSSLGLFPGDKIRISSDGSTLEFTVQRFTTMDDLADKIEEKLGYQVEVDVLRDGRIQIYNPTTTVINDIEIEAIDQDGNHVTAFEEKFAGISGRAFYRSQLRSETVYEDERFYQMTNRIEDVDDGLETVLSSLAVIGSRTLRLEMTQSQNDNIEVSLTELQSSNDYVDMAETLTKLTQQQNILSATLGAGSQVLPTSLFDFLF